MRELLENHSEHELILSLKDLFRESKVLTDEDKKCLNSYDTSDYALIGIIGLLLRSLPRILLGKLTPFEGEIRDWCQKVHVEENVLENIADKYLNDDFSEEPEFILRKVMIHYPKQD